MNEVGDFSHEDIWKAVILFGLNAATYKMALAKSLLLFSQHEKTKIGWDELAASFLDQYESRIADTGMPQQGNPSQRTVMERIVAELRLERISRSEAVARVAEKGLEHVVPRFQTIGRRKDLAGDLFYSFDYGKSLTLKDSLLAFSDPIIAVLDEEATARWSLLEGAFEINQAQFALGNDIRDIYLAKGYERKTLTSNIPFLSGYQGNVCFYCGQPLAEDIHVDHLLPRQVLCHDEIWNLVLAHGTCNLLKSDKIVGPSFIEKLVARNENIMGSNHPWKHNIAAALGKTPRRRKSTVREHYNNVKTVLGEHYHWGGGADYNPASDPFYRRLITVLNNKP